LLSRPSLVNEHLAAYSNCHVPRQIMKKAAICERPEIVSANDPFRPSCDHVAVMLDDCFTMEAVVRFT